MDEQQITDPQLFAESLVAMTGLFPSRAPSELEIRGALNYPARIRRRLASFLDAKEIADLKWKRPPAQEDLWSDVTTTIEPATMVEWFVGLEAVPPDVAIFYSQVIGAAKEFIVTAWPIYRDTSLGLHTFELSADEYGDVWHLCRTLGDPETIFDDLDSLLLLPAQVIAFKAIYPALFELTRNTAALLIRPFVDVEGVVESKKTLSSEREEQFRTLLQVPLDAPMEVAQAPTEAKAAPSRPKSDAQRREEQADARTPAEHIAQQRTAP